MREFLAKSRLFQTTDFDEGSQFAGNIWEKHKSALTRGDFGLRWNQVELNRSSLSYVEHDCFCELKAQSPLSDHFRIYFHLEGAMAHQSGGRHFTSDPQSAVVHAPSADLRANLGPMKLLLANMRGDFVRAALLQRFRRPPAIEDCSGALPQSEASEAFRSAVTWLATELERPGSPLAKDGKPRLHAERMLLSLFIESLVEKAPMEAVTALSMSDAQVRRAEEWIEAHLGEPIGVEEIAAAIGVGVRSLQLSFQRARGYAPSQAIQRLRLQRARAALLNAPPGATVTSIAADLGVFELGRFSRRYRETFGEPPSATLARRLGPLAGREG